MRPADRKRLGCAFGGSLLAVSMAHLLIGFMGDPTTLSDMAATVVGFSAVYAALKRSCV